MKLEDRLSWIRVSIWRQLLVVALTLSFGSANSSAEQVVEHGSGQKIVAARWDLLSIRFPCGDQATQPVGIGFAGVFTDAAGETHQVPGFYDGANGYVIRFCPPSAGVWTYSTRCKANVDLDGLQGELIVEPAREGRKGGIQIDPDSDTRFTYQNGEHYYPIAFECDWLFALDLENPADIPRTRSLIDTLAGNGFNQVVMNVFAYDVTWAKDPNIDPDYEYGSPSVSPFVGGNENPNFDQLNIEYFQRLDRVIEHLDSKGIAAHLMIYVWNKRVSWPDAGSEADNRYFDYVVRRYQAYPNLVWDISKEALGYGHNDVDYITDRIKRLRSIDAYKRLVTVHDYGYCQRFPKQVDFVSVQLWLSELYSVMRKTVERFPGKPILNIEHGGYEKGPYVVFNGNYTSSETCLERAYQCVFAGTYPTHYWQGAAWNVVVPDPTALAGTERPKLNYYKSMRMLVDRYDLGHFKAGDKRSNAGFCLHNRENVFVYYVPKECEFFGLNPPRDQGDRMTFTWFNPFTGEFSKPITKKMTRWPAVKTPNTPGFDILIMELSSDE